MRSRYLMFVLLFFFFLFSLFILFVPGKHWDGKTRLAVAIFNKANESVTIVVMDPKTHSITKIPIPAGLELEVARDLGVWKLASIWQLGINEKVGGGLLSQSLTKSLAVPIEAWAEGEVKDKSILFGKSNIGIMDRIRIKLFLLTLGNSDSLTIDLMSLGVIVPAKLTDGTLGYKLHGVVSQKFVSVFGDELISKENLKIALEVPKGFEREEKQIVSIIENLGSKVAIVKRNDFGGDCVLMGKDSATSNKLMSLFLCKKENQMPGGYDLEIRLGEDFFKRF